MTELLGILQQALAEVELGQTNNAHDTLERAIELVKKQNTMGARRVIRAMRTKGGK